MITGSGGRRTERTPPVVVALLLLLPILSATVGGSASAQDVVPQGMVLIPGGWSIMGSNRWDGDEAPEQRVYLKAFFIDRYEVTNGRYRRFDPGHRFPPGGEDLPVTGVTWDEALAYARWAGKRLPTEEEWEKSARGTDGRTFPWGEEYGATICNVRQSLRASPSPGGGFPKDRSPFGVYDLAGNVAEWTASWYQPYPAYPGRTIKNDDFGETFRVIRGSWWDGDFDCTARASYRNFARPDLRSPGIGFRTVKDVEP